MSWTPDAGDYAEALRLVMGWLRLRTILAVALVVVFAVGAVVAVAIRDWALLVAFAVGCSVGAVLWAVIGPFSDRWGARRLLRRNPLLAEPRQGRLVEGEGVVISMPSATSRLPWSAFVGSYETANTFVLRLPGSLMQIVVIAKRGIQPPATSTEVALLLATEVPRRSR